ncbi:retrovirus-related pol polyprotein LINE-1 [Tanacetum coccineum]
METQRMHLDQESHRVFYTSKGHICERSRFYIEHPCKYHQRCGEGREFWWLCEEVQSKVAVKQARLKELLSCREGNQEERFMAHERGIKLLGQTMKLWEKVIERRLRRETTVSKNQFCFMPERSSVEAIYLIRSLIEKYIERQTNLDMAFLDLEKAYDSVLRQLIWKTLTDKGTPRRYIRVIKDMYDGVQTRVQTSIGNTKFFPVEVGLHQESAYSLYIFALILDELSRGIQEDIPWCPIFVDDIVLVLESTEGLNNRLENWREALEDNGLRVSMEYLRCDFSNIEIAYNEEVDICIGDKILQPKEFFRYLRSMMHKSGRIDEDVSHMLDMIPNLVYRAELEVETIINKIREGRLRWFGHVRIRPQSAPIKIVEGLVVDGLRRRGRLKLRWEDKVKLDIKELLLSEDMTYDRNEWRDRIRLGG